MYDRVNIELFQQYKGAIFAGSMFLFLAILGLPYMDYDVAHQMPSFTFMSLGIGIVAIVCTVFMFLLDWSFDTFVAYISTAVIFMTILSKVGGSDVGGAEFPEFAKVLLQFVLAGGAILGTWKGAEAALARNMVDGIPWLRTILQQYSQLAPIGLLGMLAYAIYMGISKLVAYRNEKLPCNVPEAAIEATAGAPVRAVRFEGFQDTSSPSPYPSLASKLQTAIDRAQDTLDSLVEQTDQTCAIIKEVEQGYVGAKSGPEDEMEYKLPETEQQQRKNRRQERAQKAFATNRGIYAATRNTTPLECFQNPNTDSSVAAAIADDASDEDITLRELCVQLHNLLENTETLAQIRKIQQMEVDLDFAGRQLNKSEAETFQNGVATDEKPTATQIYATLRGSALEEAAQKLLQKERSLFNSVQAIEQKVSGLRSRMGKTYRKANMVATGDYNVTEAELKKPVPLQIGGL